LKMGKAKLMRTRKGHGFKLVVDGTWYYASAEQVSEVVEATKSSCVFRTRDEFADGSVQAEGEAAQYAADDTDLAEMAAVEGLEVI
jgi:hypothetical protein